MSKDKAKNKSKYAQEMAALNGERFEMFQAMYNSVHQEELANLTQRLLELKEGVEGGVEVLELNELVVGLGDLYHE
ncbi:hypothetical protein LCGC14_1519840 [marine sediment metagenome]|uniref:Uncharacterized protein n=1 Tax=marine sediment metagenome TaxID=412755 RepID=A0A0F9LEJ5_9ZZZZ